MRQFCVAAQLTSFLKFFIWAEEDVPDSRDLPRQTACVSRLKRKLVLHTFSSSLRLRQMFETLLLAHPWIEPLYFPRVSKTIGCKHTNAATLLGDPRHPGMYALLRAPLFYGLIWCSVFMCVVTCLFPVIQVRDYRVCEIPPCNF